MSLRSQLIEQVRNHSGWVHSVQLEDFARSLGYKSSNSGRRCRELVKDGIFVRKLEKGVVWYKIAFPSQNAPQVANLASSEAPQSKLFNLTPKYH